MEETPTALRAAFTDRTQAIAARDRLHPGGVVERFADVVGLDEGRDRLAVERAGPFAVHPPWLPPPADLVGIEIDPGHAFGSGSHPSTRLALILLDRVVRPGVAVADIGCGTGVLAIAAARRGARVVAVDIDPAAVEATAGNARRNGVAEAIDVRLGSVESLVEPFDAALVNVTVDIHERLASGFAPPPRLLVAGVLVDQLDRVTAAYRATEVERRTDGDWAAAILRSRSGGGPKPARA